MADIIAFEAFRKGAETSEVLALFKAGRQARGGTQGAREKPDFPSARPGVSGNLGDLFEHASAVVMRHYNGDAKVPDIVARKCLELIEALSQHAEPE